MRIRKNLKLSPLLFLSSPSEEGGADAFQAHVCQLNQSPWDVIPFDSDSIQFECDDSFTAAANGSAVDSIGAVESSVASMMEIDEQVKLEDAAATGIMQLFNSNDNNVGRHNDGKGAKVAAAANNKKPAAAARGNKTRAAGVKKPAAATSSANPYEFYYYSGFGPSWSKRRGDRNGREGGKNNSVENSALHGSEDVVMTTIAPTTATDDVVIVANNNNGTTVDAAGASSSMENIVEELDYVDIDDEEEEDDNGKKRMRKPVKARSLKSLM